MPSLSQSPRHVSTLSLVMFEGFHSVFVLCIKIYLYGGKIMHAKLAISLSCAIFIKIFFLVVDVETKTFYLIFCCCALCKFRVCVFVVETTGRSFHFHKAFSSFAGTTNQELCICCCLCVVISFLGVGNS